VRYDTTGAFKQVSTSTGTPRSICARQVASTTVIVRAAVVPQPPLIVPELVGGALAETEPVRTACLAAAAALAQFSDEWIAVAASPWGPAVIEPDAVGTFRGYGVDVPVSLSANSTGEPDPELPLPALIAGWLRGRAGAGRVRVRLLGPDEDYAEIGAELAVGESAGLLVLGDGSNRHGPGAPGREDDRSGPFDEALASALATGDAAALRALDRKLAEDLGATGWPAWQVLAAALPDADARLDYSATPFGVGYHVAVWDPRVC
jgi:hypothetical protein